MNIQNYFHMFKNIVHKNFSSMIKNNKNVNWKDNIDKYCLAEKGLLSELDLSSSLLEDTKLEKMDLMEKGLIKSFIYEIDYNKNEKLYDKINKKHSEIKNKNKNYDAYGSENFIEEKMYFSNDI